MGKLALLDKIAYVRFASVYRDFQDVEAFLSELKDLITWAMSFTCKNFIYEAGILARSKKVTIISPLKMSPQDAYRVFLLSLSSMGLTVVPKGNVLRIVEAAQAKGETLPIFKKGTPGNSDEVVRAILRPTDPSSRSRLRTPASRVYP